MNVGAHGLDALAIVEEIVIAATIERVFDALVTPAELMRWWTEPGSCVAVEWRMDARQGGDWISRWRWNDGREFAIGGTIIELRRPTLLQYDWWDDRYPGLTRTLVRYDLTRSGPGTLLRVTHSGFTASRTDRADYAGGWARVLDKVARFATAAQHTA
jgi:uncharacterized protein YndB with AHSA1/START domain